ncbi:MAG: hypothetical protein FJX57_16395, partial [Alphaproteobacteria bacterium]|nr:hypothetical protein [Alphaproteobacteria bacterium]
MGASPRGSAGSRRPPVPLELVAGRPGFVEGFARLVASARETVEQVDSVAAAIVEDVRRRRDAALVEYTRRFDRVNTDAKGLA